MTELLGENIFSWMDLLTKSLQQMFCLRYGFASAVPKISVLFPWFSLLCPSLHFNLLNFISCLTWSSCLYAPRNVGLPWSPRQTEPSPESTLQAHPRVPSTLFVFLAPADLSVPAQGLPLHKAFLPLDTQAVCTRSLLQLEV